MNNLKKVLVTGASSFLGTHLVPKLRMHAGLIYPKRDSDGKRVPSRFEILTPSSSELNLLNYKTVYSFLNHHRPDTIIHMAARCGGIGANKNNPAVFLHDNIVMTSNLFGAINLVNNDFSKTDRSSELITHFYGLGSVCGYPVHCPVPFNEDDLWAGSPERTNAPYGNSKRMLLVYQQAFREQFGLKGAHLILANLMGEYDHFDLNNSHVIPALIRKFVEAKKQNKSSVDVWGDGSPTREFLYAGDASDAICKAVINRVDYPKPINIGTGKDISIKDLSLLIKELVGFNGDIIFNDDKSVNGQPKRRLSVSRAKDVLGFESQTSLREGLKKIINWYQGK